MLTRKEFEKIQKTTGLNLELLGKVYHLTRMLNEIGKYPILKENLTLKGGTALNFLYLDIPRLSIDLDFDYTGKITKEEMTKQRPWIEKEIKDIASKLKYKIKDRGSSYIISRQSLQYQTTRNTKDQIKVEINYLNRIPLGKRDVKKFIDFTNRPQSIYIQFFNRIYEFGIRPSFWDGCYEFVDAQEKTNSYPIRELFINKLGFNLNNKNCCHILSKVEEFNKKLKIICIYEI